MSGIWFVVLNEISSFAVPGPNDFGVCFKCPRSRERFGVPFAPTLLFAAESSQAAGSRNAGSCYYEHPPTNRSSELLPQLFLLNWPIKFARAEETLGSRHPSSMPMRVIFEPFLKRREKRVHLSSESLTWARAARKTISYLSISY